jgi:hypothetical protein
VVRQTLALDRHSKELAAPALMTAGPANRDIVEQATSDVLGLDHRLFVHMRQQGAPTSSRDD